MPNEVAQEWYKKRRICEEYRLAKKVASTLAPLLPFYAPSV